MVEKCPRAVDDEAVASILVLGRLRDLLDVVQGEVGGDHRDHLVTGKNRHGVGRHAFVPSALVEIRGGPEAAPAFDRIGEPFLIAVVVLAPGQILFVQLALRIPEEIGGEGLCLEGDRRTEDVVVGFQERVQGAAELVAAGGSQAILEHGREGVGAVFDRVLLGVDALAVEGDQVATFVADCFEHGLTGLRKIEQGER